MAEIFEQFLDIQPPDSTASLPLTTNFRTLIIQDKDEAMESIQDVKKSNMQIIVYSDSSRIQDKNTAAVAWCANKRQFNTLQLGKETEYGIYEAETSWLILALHLAKSSFQATPQRITMVLDNQGVVKDMATKKNSSRALTHKINAINTIKKMEEIDPHVKSALRWCPGHKGVEGNKQADHLNNAAAKRA